MSQIHDRAHAFAALLAEERLGGDRGFPLKRDVAVFVDELLGILFGQLSAGAAGTAVVGRGHQSEASQRRDITGIGGNCRPGRGEQPRDEGSQDRSGTHGVSFCRVIDQLVKDWGNAAPCLRMRTTRSVSKGTSAVTNTKRSKPGKLSNS